MLLFADACYNFLDRYRNEEIEAVVTFLRHECFMLYAYMFVVFVINVSIIITRALFLVLHGTVTVETKVLELVFLRF